MTLWQWMSTMCTAGVMALATAGCDELDATSATVTLAISNPDGLSTEGLEAGVDWLVEGHTNHHELGFRAGVSGTEVKLVLDGGPPASLLNDYTFGGLRPMEAKIGTATLMVFPRGWDPMGDAYGSVGVARYVIVWIDEDLRPDTFTAALVGGALTRGYHLLKVTPAAEYREAHPEIAACDDFLPDCQMPSSEDDRPGWTTYFECERVEALRAGCMTDARHDHLAPADDDLQRPIEVELHSRTLDLDIPNWT